MLLYIYCHWYTWILYGIIFVVPGFFVTVNKTCQLNWSSSSLLNPARFGLGCNNWLPDGESNPGLPRDRRGYLPLYYFYITSHCHFIWASYFIVGIFVRILQHFASYIRRSQFGNIIFMAWHSVLLDCSTLCDFACGFCIGMRIVVLLYR